MASYEGPGISIPVYDVSQSIEIDIDKDQNAGSGEAEAENQHNDLDRERSKSNVSMLDIIIVGNDKAVDTNSMYEEKEAILIDDGRRPCSDDTIIDLNIDSEALRFVSVFLLITFQRIPRHYSDRVKAILVVCQFFIVFGMLTAVAYDMGAFGNKNTLTTNDFGNLITSLKNVICNAKFPFLYIVGIFYFRTRHLEYMLSKVRLTKRYWKYGRKVLISMVIAVLCLTVVIPAISNTAQMSFTNKSSPNEHYRFRAIALSCIVTLLVRLMSLSVVFAFILVVYLIYCQVRMFKEQIQKWPLECSSIARNVYNDICRMIRNAERAFQPFLIVHFTILLVLLVPLVISCVEQYEAIGRYYDVVTTSKSIPLKSPIFNVKDEQSQSSLVKQIFKHHYQELETPDNNTKSSPMDEFNKNAKETKVEHLDTGGIVKICLMILADVLDAMALFGLPVVLIGKVDKCIKGIRDSIRMLNFGQQIENHYIVQSEKDIALWDSILSDARGLQVLGFNLASFKAVLIGLLFPFVTVVLRFMMKHVNINP